MAVIESLASTSHFVLDVSAIVLPTVAALYGAALVVITLIGLLKVRADPSAAKGAQTSLIALAAGSTLLTALFIALLVVGCLWLFADNRLERFEDGSYGLPTKVMEVVVACVLAVSINLYVGVPLVQTLRSNKQRRAARSAAEDNEGY